MRRLVAAATTAVAAGTASSAAGDGPLAAAGAVVPAAQAITAAVHLFEWDWPSVALECETVLGPKGYDGVQISPPLEHLAGEQWWTRYQTVSYQLVSRSGNESQFRDMVKRCNAAGVMVIVDAVINHMARGKDGHGKGVAGNTFGDRVYPGVPFGQEDFHHDILNPASNCMVDKPSDFHDTHIMQYCDLTGLPDLNTERPQTLAKINELLTNFSAMGTNVGFRFDAAKSIPAAELDGIVRAAGSPWQYCEVHSGAVDAAALQPPAYTGTGRVTEFEFQNQVGRAFKAMGLLSGLHSIGETSGLIPSNKALVFIENHDTMQAGCFSCAPVVHDDGAPFFLANVFMLAWPYGYPLVMSSFVFPPGDHDAGPPGYPVTCGKGWNCEHRRPEVANMVAWRRTAGSLPVEGFTSDPSNSSIYFSRGGLAFVALHRLESTPWSAWMHTRLPAGSYCDVIQSDDSASCPHIEVNGSGFAWITVPPVGAVAMHVGKRFTGPASEGDDGFFVPWGLLSFGVLSVFAISLCFYCYVVAEAKRIKKMKIMKESSSSEVEAGILLAYESRHSQEGKLLSDPDPMALAADDRGARRPPVSTSPSMPVWDQKVAQPTFIRTLSSSSPAVVTTGGYAPLVTPVQGRNAQNAVVFNSHPVAPRQELQTGDAQR